MLTCMRTWLGLAARLPLLATAEPADEQIWNKLRANIFTNRTIIEGSPGIVEIDAPERAEDAATVPIAIRATPPAGSNSPVQRIYLVIDRNPSPLGAVFTFFPDSGRAAIETRVRIEDYTTVRAIAELADGKLYMSSRYVKAAGGCSAPAGRDKAASQARLGRIKFRVDEPVSFGQPGLAQLMISHPNSSGLAMDQLTRLYETPHFVRRVDVRYDGRPVLLAEVDFTISENPNFRFPFLPRQNGTLTAEIIDTEDKRFTSTLAVSGAPAAR